MIEIYFKNGVFQKIKPDGADIRFADILVSDGKKYDLKDVDSIKSIPIPKYSSQCGDVTKQIEFCLKKCSSLTNDETFLAITRKRIEMFAASPFEYQAAEYYVLPHKLYEMGKFEEGDAELKQMQNAHPAIFSDNARLKEQLNNAIRESITDYGSDLIEYVDDWIKCDVCGTFKGRVYSAYGNNKKFPKLPGHLRDGACKTCGGQFMPFEYKWRSRIYNYSESGQQIEVDAKKRSNQPFVDNRTIAAKKRFEEYLERRKVKNEAEKLMHFRAYCVLKMTDTENCPKSFSAYMRKINKEG